MKFFTEVGRWLEPPDTQAISDFTKARTLVDVSEDTRNMAKILSEGNFRFSKTLSGENGSPRLLYEQETQTPVVMKTYEPTADMISGQILEHTDRVEQLREEAAAFLVTEAFPIAHVPTTVLRKISPDVLKAWGVPQLYFSDQTLPHDQAVMLQQYIPDAHTFAAAKKSLPLLATAQTIFGQLAYDYLVAYGDGRFGNLLISVDILWAIDHGKSFRLNGIIRGTESLGIPEDYALEDTSGLLAGLQPEKSNMLQQALGILVGREKTKAFEGRFTRLHTALSENSSITIAGLRHILS